MMIYGYDDHKKDEENLANALLRSIKEGSILHYYNQTFESSYTGRVVKRNEERTNNNRIHTTFTVQVLDEEGNDTGQTDTAFLRHINELIAI